MGHRLSSIYTRTGDDGTTGLGDGQRVAKDHPRVDAYGEVDELNSLLGVVRACGLHPDMDRCLEHIQHELFDLGGELCIPGYSMIKQSHIDTLERELDALNDTLPPLKEFILPGGTAAASHCHVARAVSRRAERRLVSLSRTEEVSPLAIGYLNRLSDLLFVLCRILNKEGSRSETLWRSPRTRNEGDQPLAKTEEPD